MCTSGEFLKQSVLENLIGVKINFLFYEGLIRTVNAFIRLSGLPFIKKAKYTLCIHIIFLEQHSIWV